jgi:hypothetical protein
MQKHSPKIFFGVAIMSLLILAGMFIKGFSQEKSAKQNKAVSINGVLGQQTNILKDAASDIASPLNSAIQKSIDGAKETVSLKTVEVEKMVVSTLEKEVADFSKSQVDNLKFQICRDWGVLNLSPTPSI